MRLQTISRGATFSKCSSAASQENLGTFKLGSESKDVPRFDVPGTSESLKFAIGTLLPKCECILSAVPDSMNWHLPLGWISGKYEPSLC